MYKELIIRPLLLTRIMRETTRKDCSLTDWVEPTLQLTLHMLSTLLHPGRSFVLPRSFSSFVRPAQLVDTQLVNARLVVAHVVSPCSPRGRTFAKRFIPNTRRKCRTVRKFRMADITGPSWVLRSCPFGIPTSAATTQALSKTFQFSMKYCACVA